MVPLCRKPARSVHPGPVQDALSTDIQLLLSLGVLSSLPRPTQILVDQTALEKNLALVRCYAPSSRVICCVKANAYGHGLIESARTLAVGADALAVACIEEALVVRRAGLDIPILLLEGVFSPEELEQVRASNLWMVVHSQDQLAWVLEHTESSEAPLGIWLKFDTGMHRLGFDLETGRAAYGSLKANIPDLCPRLMTHFASADELDNDFTASQMHQFDEACAGLVGERSAANSAAVLNWPMTHLDWVRPGFMLYGISPFGQTHSSATELVPAMSFQSEVIAVRTIKAGESVGYNQSWKADKTTRIAAVAAGYGDGYPRNTRSGTPVLIDGKRAQTVGHVAMDMLMVDVSGLAGVVVGSHVELWGHNLSVNEVAASSGYSPYELLSRLPERAERIFV